MHVAITAPARDCWRKLAAEIHGHHVSAVVLRPMRRFQVRPRRGGGAGRQQLHGLDVPLVNREGPGSSSGGVLEVERRGLGKHIQLKLLGTVRFARAVRLVLTRRAV